ncbi:MAG: hypothetical protein I3274_02770 [Candidatus Moeniiplasma glomeromycotorum]|nr:hypothetical protein [Candidatus Moeniiplasma glomeromycotorum]MCE8167528.1 hypothetical protein [Candidatus Moeniiplasma glomeromycotorum]
MTEKIIIVLLVIALLYLSQQNRKKQTAFLASDPDYQQQVSKAISELKLDKEMLETEREDWKTKQAETQAKLTSKETELTLILNKWNWGKWKPQSASEFINKFEPWIEKHLEQEKEIKEFLKDVKADSLQNVSHQFANLEKENQKLQNEVERLKENREESETVANLESDNDQLKRDKYSLEQENIALNNRLKNKVSELNEKEKDLERSKKEQEAKQEKINELDKKYKAKVKQLDAEQSEANKLEEKVAQLEVKINELETERINSTKPPMPGEWNIQGGGEWEKELKEQHKLELAQIARQLVPEEELPAEITLESVLELAKKKKNRIRATPDIRPAAEDKVSVEQEREKVKRVSEFREWLDADEEKLLDKVDWAYYEKQVDWIKEFRKWNRLRGDRIGVLEKWLSEAGE